MKIAFEILTRGEPDAGIFEKHHNVTIELHEIDDGDDEWKEATIDALKPALAELFDTPVHNVKTTEELDRAIAAMLGDQ